MYLLTARSRHEPETPEEVWVEVKTINRTRTTVIGWRCANITRLFLGYVAVTLRVFFSEGLFSLSFASFGFFRRHELPRYLLTLLHALGT